MSGEPSGATGSGVDAELQTGSLRTEGRGERLERSRARGNSARPARQHGGGGPGPLTLSDLPAMGQQVIGLTMTYGIQIYT